MTDMEKKSRAYLVQPAEGPLLGQAMTSSTPMRSSTCSLVVDLLVRGEHYSFPKDRCSSVLSIISHENQF